MSECQEGCPCPEGIQRRKNAEADRQFEAKQRAEKNWERLEKKWRRDECKKGWGFRR